MKRFSGRVMGVPVVLPPDHPIRQLGDELGEAQDETARQAAFERAAQRMRQRAASLPLRQRLLGRRNG